MADTGFQFPTVSDGARTIAGSDANWDFPDNNQGDEGAFCIYSVVALEQSAGLAGAGFDFSVIPFGSTIDGIEVQVGDYGNLAGGTVTTFEVLRLILADDSDGANSKHADLTQPTTGFTTDQAGGAADLWGETLTVADVQDPDFGFFLGIEIDTGTFRSDFMQMKVFYTEPQTYNTGWQFPGTVTQEGSDNAFVNPDNVKADDASVATCDLGIAEASNFLIATNFGFRIPAGATIVGMEARMGDYRRTAGTGTVFHNATKLRNADETDGATLGIEFVTYSDTAQTEEAGGEFVLWGETPSPGAVEDIDFGWSFDLLESIGQTADIEIDFMQMRVFYVLPDTFATDWTFPGTMVGDRTVSGSTENWLNFNNAKADDGVDADVTLDPEHSAGLAASNFGFSMPVGAIITGIEIRVEDFQGSTSTNWHRLRLILADDSDGTAQRSAELTDFAVPDSTGEVGGQHDLWGETLAISDVEDVDFGFFVSAIQSAGNALIEVDSMQMRIHYATPSEATTWKFPGTMDGARIGFGVAWSNPDNAKADDTSDTTNTVTGTGPVMDQLGSSNYDYAAIPDGSIIDGIEVRLGDYSENASDNIDLLSVRLILADDSDGSENKFTEIVAFTTTDNTDEAGGAADLWGETITLADVQDVDFGWVLAADGVSAGTNIASIDFMQQRVFYTAPTIVTTGWKFPGTVETPVGGTNWGSPDNVKADDGSNATCALFADAQSRKLIAKNFDFSVIPSDASIVGLEFRAGAYLITSGTGKIIFTNARINMHDDSDSASTGFLSAPSGSLKTSSFGTPASLFGETPTVANVQDNDFGWSFFWDETQSASTTGAIDFMQMRVFYVEAVGGDGFTGQGTLGTVPISGFLGTMTSGFVAQGTLGTATVTGFAGTFVSEVPFVEQGTLGTLGVAGLIGTMAAGFTAQGPPGLLPITGFAGLVCNESLVPDTIALMHGLVGVVADVTADDGDWVESV